MKHSKDFTKGGIAKGPQLGLLDGCNKREAIIPSSVFSEMMKEKSSKPKIEEMGQITKDDIERNIRAWKARDNYYKSISKSFRNDVLNNTLFFVIVFVLAIMCVLIGLYLY